MPVMGCDGESSTNSPGSFISNISLNSSMSSMSSSSNSNTTGGGGHHELLPGSPAVCAGCGGRISDRFYLLAADRQWHTQCLQCCECNVQLDSELSCFAKEGNIYCKEDYLKRYGTKKCARCHVGIESHEMVMRARELVYHLACFSCAVCNLELTTGDYYGMRDHLVYCQLHYETLFVPSSEQSTYHHLHHASPPPPQPTLHNLSPSYHTHGGSPNPGAPSTGHPFFQNGLSPIHKGRPRKRKGVDHLIGFGMGMNDPCDPMGHHGHHPGLDGDMYHQHVPAARTKRMRTSFKHHQLRTMKSYFAMNHNPDAKDLKQLAHKTGLTKRVLQVWFQNARAKYRRTSTKKDDEKSEKNASDGGDQASPSTQIDDQDNISITSSGGCGGSGSGSDPTADTLYDGDEDDEDKLLDEITTYSELKTASPAVADEVSTISSMPASARMLHGLHGQPGSTPGNMHHGMGLMSHGFVEIFSNTG